MARTFPSQEQWTTARHRRLGFETTDLDSDHNSSEKHRLKSYGGTLVLAYQSLGVVFGDLCISPIYVYANTFSGKHRLQEQDTEIMGVLSLVFWTLTLIALCKYIIVVLAADDNGEGGAFALYSKICRSLPVGLVDNQSFAHEQLSAYESETACRKTRTGLIIESFLEKHKESRFVLFFIVILGASMLVGDGVLTPTMSVLSAVSGIRVKAPELHESYTVIIACVILVGLFTLQHSGTRRVGFLFAPVLIAWLACISMIGVYNIFKWNPLVVQAISPYEIFKFFKHAGKDGWYSLGGIVLCITGVEAMFANLGHFSKLSLRMAFTCLVYPSLLLAYMGEAAYLSKHKEDLHTSFYSSIPDCIFWPVFVFATLTTIVGSQATISATFSLISQCQALGCFPRVKVIHTSNHIHGQIYIPEVNWLLLFLCLSITIGFREASMIGHAYGLAVITVMFVTTFLMFLIITTVWKRNIFLALLFTISFGLLELLFLSACVAKLNKGSWLLLFISLVMLSVMAVWHYGTSRKLAYELQNKVHIDDLLSFGPGLGLVRVPGIGLLFTSAPHGIPPIFAHLFTNFPALHQVLIFVSLQAVTIPKVPPGEQFLIGRVGPPEYLLIHCIIRYGYKDVLRDVYDFEDQLLAKVAEFLQNEGCNPAGSGMSVIGWPSQLVLDAMVTSDQSSEEKFISQEISAMKGLRKEVKELLEQKEAGVAYMIGRTHIVAHESSSFIKRIAVDVYGFLWRNCRQLEVAVAVGVPIASLLEVGMVFQV